MRLERVKLFVNNTVAVITTLHMAVLQLSCVHSEHMNAWFTWRPVCFSPCESVAVQSVVARSQESSRWSPCSVYEALCRSAAACVDWESGLPHLCGETSSACIFLCKDHQNKGVRHQSHFKCFSSRKHEQTLVVHMVLQINQPTASVPLFFLNCLIWF